MGVQKTCAADVSCSTTIPKTKDKATPSYTASEDTAPTATDCCEDITGKCSGNTAAADDFTCSGGWKLKLNSATIDKPSGDGGEETCCDKKTCDDVTCSTTKQKDKATDSYTWAAATAPTATDCCEDITLKCKGNTQASNDVSCGAHFQVKVGSYADGDSELEKKKNAPQEKKAPPKKKKKKKKKS